MTLTRYEKVIVDKGKLAHLNVCSLVYLETSAATGQNVAKAVETLVEKVMVRMDLAVDRALLPGRGGRPKEMDDPELYNTSSTSCSC